MKRYRVAQVGLGHRGKIHADGFLRNADRFELVALCELDPERLRHGMADYGVSAGYADADKMLAETRPDVFCFVTQPHTRLPLVELASKYEVKGLAFEKPMATSLREAWAITDLCRRHGIKTVVSHQQKYLTSMQELKAILDRGEIGEIIQIQATAQAWLAQLGTHFMDYVIWVNGGVRARWVVGHVHGRRKLEDSHPSPDYILGQVPFENGVRAFIECGYLSPSHMPKDKFWVDNRLTVWGSQGYAWADTDGRWGALTRRSAPEVIGAQGEPWSVQQRERLQSLYLRDLADWLDDDAKPHPCRVELAYHGYEILEGLCISALDHTRVDLPLNDPAHCEDSLARMRRELPEVALA